MKCENDNNLKQLREIAGSLKKQPQKPLMSLHPLSRIGSMGRFLETQIFCMTYWIYIALTI